MYSLSAWWIYDIISECIIERAEQQPTLFQSSFRENCSWISVQGDTSGCAKPPVDFKTKVLFWPCLAWPKQNLCFEVNERLCTTWCVTLYRNGKEGTWVNYGLIIVATVIVPDCHLRLNSFSPLSCGRPLIQGWKSRRSKTVTRRRFLL